MAKKQYYVLQKNQADLRALLRGVVTAALLYIAWKLAHYTGEDPTFPPLLAYVMCGVFAVAAAAFGVYTVKSYLAALHDAEIVPGEGESGDGEQDGEP